MMRNVVVTGGSRGLGLGIVRTLSAAGYGTIAISRSLTEDLKRAIEEVEQRAQAPVHFLSFDLSETDRIQQLAETIKERHGTIYGLVNNAGIGIGGLLATMQNADIERVVRLNTLAPIILSKYVVRMMMVTGEGRIVNMASIVAMTGFNGLSVYSATKAALVGFTRSLAREVGRAGINVNAVAPGFVDTDMTREMDESDKDRIVKRSALRRLPEIDDVANAVEFLLSEKARNVTGTVITVDAGNIA
jgi:3-oxoacyl-[acyl-carrier protein] reductase